MALRRGANTDEGGTRARARWFARRVGPLLLLPLVLPVLAGATWTVPENRPLAVPNQSNGELPGHLLTTITSTCSVYVSAGPDMTGLLAAAKADGVALVARECYRSLALQNYWRGYWCGQGSCQMAAVPGTSIHGWGKAVDFGISSSTSVGFDSPTYAWLKANAHRYGFNHPGWAEPGTSSPEPWHWEWVGDGGAMFGRPQGANVSSGAVARNQDGRLEVFGVDPDTELGHTWQAPSVGWSAVHPLGGGYVAGSAQVIDNTDGRLEVFALGDDGVVSHQFQVRPNGPWSDSYPMGAVTVAPAVGRHEDGRLALFVVDGGGRLRITSQVVAGGTWTTPATLGTGWADAPGLGRTDDGRLVVAGAGADGSLRVTIQAARNNVFPTPSVLVAPSGVAMTGRPAVGANRDGRIEVIARGDDGRLWHSWQSGGADLGRPAPLGDAHVTGDPTVIRSPDGRLEVFAAGADGRLGHTWQRWANGPWASWQSLGGPDLSTTSASTPSVSVNADGRFEVFVTDGGGASGGTTWHAWQVAPNTSWTGFVPLADDLTI